MRKNIFIAVNTFLFAIFIWLYINLNLTYNYVIVIPLEVKSSKLQAVSNELPENLEVTLKGKGWDLLSILMKNNIIYTVDLSGYKKDTKINLVQAMSEVVNLPPSVSVQSVVPDNLDISFDNTITKSIKVKNNTIIALKEGYILIGSPRIVPDSVKVTGATSVISRIKYLSTDHMDFTGIGNSFSKEVKLSDTLSNLVKVEPKSVTIFYRVELSAEKTFEDINVNVLNLPADKEVLLVPPKISLSLRGGVEQLSKINASDFKVGIEYSQIDSDEQGFVVPSIELPNDFTIIKSEPQRFQYIIKKKEN
ncbi:hypothetical protein D4R99_04150 [bacterium]|nr:MAG: hypothetical protein D4R99_04150 [bacterium]